jgi:hypothetical protein
VFIKAIAFSLALQTSQIRVVYSYDRKLHDSLEVIVNKNEKTIYHKNHTLFTDIDSTDIGYATKTDTVEVILRGYKKDLFCIPHIDKLKYPYYRMSYGLNFECIKIKA